MGSSSAWAAGWEAHDQRGRADPDSYPSEADVEFVEGVASVETMNRCQRCGEAFTERSERAEVVHYPSKDEIRSYGSMAVLLDDLRPEDFNHLVVHQSCMIDGDEIA